MKKFLLALPLFAAALIHAQNRFPPINLYNGDPTGTPCTMASPLLQSQTTGYLYGCNPNSLVYQQTSAAGAGCVPSTVGSLVNLTCTGTINADAGFLVNGLGATFPSVAAFAAPGGRPVCNTQYYYAEMTAGSNVLTFVNGSVATSAMASGAMTVTVPTANTGTGALVTGVATFVDSTHLTLNASAVLNTYANITETAVVPVAIGNGDDAAFAAMETATPSGSTVFIPAGCMLTSPPLTVLQNGLKFQGAGGLTSFIVVASNSADGIDFNNQMETSYYLSASPFEIADVGIYGPSGPEQGLIASTRAAPPPYETGFGVAANYTGKVILHNSPVSGFMEGFHTYQTNGAKVENSFLTGNGVGWGMGQQSDSSSVINSTVDENLYWPVLAGVNGGASNNGPQVDGGTYFNYNGTCGITTDSKTITLNVNPTVGDTIVVNGTSIAVVASGATGNQINLGADVVFTTANLLALLQGSSDANLVKSTYTSPFPNAIVLVPVNPAFVQTATTSDAAAFVIRTSCANPNMPTATATVPGGGGVPTFTITNGGSNLPYTPYITLGNTAHCTNGKIYGTVTGGVLTAITTVNISCPTTPSVNFGFGGIGLLAGAGANGATIKAYVEDNIGPFQIGWPSDNSGSSVAQGVEFDPHLQNSFTSTVIPSPSTTMVLSYAQLGGIHISHPYFTGGFWVTGIRNMGANGGYAAIDIDCANISGMSLATDYSGRPYSIPQSGYCVSLHSNGSQYPNAAVTHQPAHSYGGYQECWAGNTPTANNTCIDNNGQINQARGTATLPAVSAASIAAASGQIAGSNICTGNGTNCPASSAHPSTNVIVSTPGALANGVYVTGLTALSGTGTCVLTFSNGATATLPMTSGTVTSSTMTVTAAGTTTLVTSPISATAAGAGGASCTGPAQVTTNLTTSVAGTGAYVVIYTYSVPALTAGQCAGYVAAWARTGTWNASFSAKWTLAGTDIGQVFGSPNTSNQMAVANFSVCNNTGVTNAQMAKSASAVLNANEISIPQVIATALNFTGSQTLTFSVNYPNTDFYVPITLDQVSY
jgi:hypothetical protein